LDSFIASLEPSNGNLFEVISYDKVITKMIAISDSILFFGGFDHEIKELWIGTINNNFNIIEEILVGSSAHDYPCQISIYDNKIYLIVYTQGGVSGDKTSPNYGLEDTWILAFDITLSNNELSLMPDFKIYPNPTTDFIKINLPNDQYNQVQIVDMQGRVIAEMPVHNNFEQIIDVSNYKTGTYFIKAKMQNGISVSKKFVKF